MEHHPIFERFTPYSGPSPAGEHLDFIGARFRGEWSGNRSIEGCDAITAALPTLNEEYFEWCDLLEAVDAAEGAFTMVELGAGYGRWGIRGARAAQQRGLATRLIFVEAEPQHAAWIREALAINAIEGEVIEAAIAYDGQPVPFAVNSATYNAENWYGQARVGDVGEETADSYFGRKLYRSGPYGQIMAPAMTLEDVLADLDFVDLVDSDLQGAEREMILNSMPIINERVRRMHIGTHSDEIEEICRKAFTAAGWRNVWDFGLQADRDTPYGPSWFGDGVSSWINPRL